MVKAPYGYKIIGRWLGLSYTKTRNLLIKYMKLKVRTGYNISTPPVRKFRSERIKGSKSPWYNWPENMPYLARNTTTGIQGYYLNKTNSTPNNLMIGLKPKN